jgi:DNA-binding transcriptional regulator GbsR (MarR family)
MKLSEEQSAFVELTGRWFESFGGGRTAGRILGWLMISDPPHQSSADLIETLEVSAGSVSTQIRRLETIGLAERVTFHGDRATYYQLPLHVWLRTMNGEIQRIEEMRKLVVAAEGLVPRDRPDRVMDLGKVVGFLSEEWPGVLARLKDHIEKEEK